MHLTRRSALLTAAAGLLSACTAGSGTRSARALDPDVALTAAAVAREQALLAAYDAALAALPALAARLAPLRAEHLEHLTALGAVAPSPAATPVGAALPAAGALVRLRALEHSSAAGHAGAALTASRQLAPVLASLAASESSHAAVL